MNPLGWQLFQSPDLRRLLSHAHLLDAVQVEQIVGVCLLEQERVVLMRLAVNGKVLRCIARQGAKPLRGLAVFSRRLSLGPGADRGELELSFRQGLE